LPPPLLPWAATRLGAAKAQMAAVVIKNLSILDSFFD
jgi:hypothetical protein